MPSSLLEFCCARLPRDAVALLARLRTEPGVLAALTERDAWIRWDADSDIVLRAVMPIHGVELFRSCEGKWYRLGQTLPFFDFPTHLEFMPLAHLLFPAAIAPLAATTSTSTERRRVLLSLTRDDHPRAASAVLCNLTDLSSWSDSVPTARLSSLQAACLDDSALVLGSDLPLLPSGVRFWGAGVLVPLGYAIAPALPESALREAAGVSDEQLLLWHTSQVEIVDRNLFTPLTRARIRLALREGRP